MPELKPCPGCGESGFTVFIQELNGEWQGYCGCGHATRYYKTREAAIAAWNKLPRALTWTTEPPKVAGWYWMRRKLHGKWRNRGIVHIYMDFSGTKTLQAKGWGRMVGGLESLGIDFEWAGPIPTPLEQEES